MAKRKEKTHMISIRVPVKELAFLRKLKEKGMSQTKFILDSLKERKEKLSLEIEEDKISTYLGYDIYEVYNYNNATDEVVILGYKSKKHDWESDVFKSLDLLKKDIEKQKIKDQKERKDILSSQKNCY